MFEEESALLPKLRGDEVMESLSEVTSPEAEEAAIAEALAAVDAGSDEKEQATMVIVLEYSLHHVNSSGWIGRREKRCMF